MWSQICIYFPKKRKGMVKYLLFFLAVPCPPPFFDVDTAAVIVDSGGTVWLELEAPITVSCCSSGVSSSSANNEIWKHTNLVRPIHGKARQKNNTPKPALRHTSTIFWVTNFRNFLKIIALSFNFEETEKKHCNCIVNKQKLSLFSCRSIFFLYSINESLIQFNVYVNKNTRKYTK